MKFSTVRYGVDTHPVSERAVLLLMGADGSRKQVLRHADARFENGATFSPDGRSIPVRPRRADLPDAPGRKQHTSGAAGTSSSRRARAFPPTGAWSPSGAARRQAGRTS